MKDSVRKASQDSKLPARGEERAAQRLLSECASSPRASLAFSALWVVRTLRDILGDLCRRFVSVGKAKKYAAVYANNEKGTNDLPGDLPGGKHVQSSLRIGQVVDEMNTQRRIAAALDDSEHPEYLHASDFQAETRR